MGRTRGLSVTLKAVVWALGCMSIETAHAFTCQDLFQSTRFFSFQASVQEPSAASAARPVRPLSDLGLITWKRSEIRDLNGVRTFLRTGIFTSSEPETLGLQLAFDFSRSASRPTSRPSVILLHGVLDRRQDLDGLSREIEKQGWDLLRVDLLGHGLTAQLNRQHDNPGKPIDFHLQIQMLTALSRKIHANLQTEPPVLIGHSLGGGITMAMAVEMGAAGLRPRAIVPITPLLASLDRYLKKHGLSPEVVGFYNEQMIKKFGLGSGYGQMMGSFFQVMMEPARRLTDPNSTIAFMEKNFRQYQEQKNETLPADMKMTPEEIELFVQGGIAATLGVRDFDFQSAHDATELDASIPTLLISGDSDEVVIPPQVAGFRAFAEKRGYDISFVQMNGDHHLPQTQPQAVMDVIANFMRSRGLLKTPEKK